MRLLVSLSLLAILLHGCKDYSRNNDDPVYATINEDKAKADLTLLKEIITEVHAGAYAYNTPEELNRFADSIINSVNFPLNRIQLYNKANLIAEKVKCLHTEVYFNDDFIDSIKSRPAFFPIPLIVIDGKLYVNSSSWIIPLASEIISINNTPAGEIINNLSPYAHSDGYSTTYKKSAVDDDFAFNYYTAYGAADQFLINYKNEETGKNETRNITARTLKEIGGERDSDTYFYYADDVPYDFEILDKTKTAVLKVRTFDFETNNSTSAFSHFTDNCFRMMHQNDTRNLVIDLRNNGGGYYSDAFSLVSHLVNTELPEFDSITKRFDKVPYSRYIDIADTSKITSEDTLRNEFVQIRNNVFTQSMDYIDKCRPRNFMYKGNIFLIINNRVASAASTFASVLKDRTNALLVGEETTGDNAAHNSSVINYVLPNSGLKICIPTKRFYQPVKGLKPGRGVLPHKYIAFTKDDLINNTDAALSYVLDSFIRK